MDTTSNSLLIRARNGTDGAAWQRLVDIYTPFLERLVQHFDMWHEDRDDLLQEVFAVVVHEIGRFEHNGQRGAFRRWLRTIALHRLRTAWRARNRRPPADGSVAVLELEQSPINELEELWDREHDTHVAKRLLALLEPEFALSTWLAFRRQVLEGLSAAETSRELGISVNAVLIAKSRVLRRLRQEIDGLID